MCQPVDQVRPYDISIGLDEDVPLGIWHRFQCPVNHGQELPLVQLPSRVVGLSKGTVLVVAPFFISQTFAANLLQTVVDVELGLAVHGCFGHVAENIIGRHAADSFLVVGEDGVIGNTLEGCAELHGDLLLRLGGARLQDNKDIIHIPANVPTLVLLKVLLGGFGCLRGGVSGRRSRFFDNDLALLGVDGMFGMIGDRVRVAVGVDVEVINQAEGNEWRDDENPSSWGEHCRGSEGIDDQ